MVMIAALRVRRHTPKMVGIGRTAQEEASLSISGMMETFEQTKEYLAGAAWYPDGTAYAPDETAGNVSETWSLVSDSVACGDAGVRQVQHIRAHLPRVRPDYVMDVLLSPDYDPAEWNPSISIKVYATELAVGNTTDFLGTFRRGGDRGDKHEDSGQDSGPGEPWPVVGQVIEVPLPAAVRRLAGGARYSADWISAGFDCPALRGFMLSTSRGAELLADAAGVAQGQEMCMSAILVAPQGADGTALHWMQHLDPHAPSAIRGAVLAAVVASTRRTIDALHEKARSVQETGAPTRLICAGSAP